MKRNYVIPFFMLHKGCPHQCIFCDQRRITGQENIRPGEVGRTIERYLSTIPSGEANIEIGFFGGTFTGLPRATQEEFLCSAYPFVREGRVKGIRLSTRPDFIDKAGLELLKKYGVTCVELGVQSMSDMVLSLARRGYNSGAVEEASSLILEEGFTLGHQIMVGLPSSRLEDEYFTARRAVELGAAQVRIYPLIVIKDTELAVWLEQKKFEPLDEDEAIERCMRLILYFEANGVKVIRCGLHPSEGLLTGDDFLAGPFHPSFRQKVENRLFGVVLNELHKEKSVSAVLFNPQDESAIFGFKKENSLSFQWRSRSSRSTLIKDNEVPRGCLVIMRNGKTSILDRKQMAERILRDDERIKC